MNKRQVIGLVLLIVGVAGYFLKPIEAGSFEFLYGICAAIGVGLLLGWIRKN